MAALVDDAPRGGSTSPLSGGPGAGGDLKVRGNVCEGSGGDERDSSGDGGSERGCEAAEGGGAADDGGGEGCGDG